MSEKPQFASRLGLIAATVGSAVGLGNIWRFPAEAQANGGAAFLIVYILCVFILGVPVMVGEFALGRGGQSNAVGSFKALGASRPWWAVGGLALIASYMILCFYMVVAGWTIEYLWESITGALYAPAPGETDSLRFSQRMELYIASAWHPLMFTFIVILINFGILLGGVQKGIERLSNIMMPLLFLILIVFACVSLSLDGASEGLRFFLNPDFSKITPRVIVNALGQAFFSLSLGMGILITYSSYFPRTTRLAKTAVTVSMLDLLVAFLMGIVIFPAVTTFGLGGESLRGATLVFVTLPEVFARMPASSFWSALFFLLLSVAAITSTISIAEVTVAFLHDRFRMRRRWAVVITLAPLFIFSSICSLSQGPLSDITIVGFNIFDLLDNVATNIMLPLCSLLLCVYMGWFAPKGLLREQITNGSGRLTLLQSCVIVIIRYIAPLLIAVVFISYFL